MTSNRVGGCCGIHGVRQGSFIAVQSGVTRRTTPSCKTDTRRPPPSWVETCAVSRGRTSKCIVVVKSRESCFNFLVGLLKSQRCRYSNIPNTDIGNRLAAQPHLGYRCATTSQYVPHIQCANRQPYFNGIVLRKPCGL